MQWVDALDLDRWARTNAAREDLSKLIAKLVRASARDINSFRFPTGDSAAIPGYDGQLVSTGSPPYVPEGPSVWEFGTESDYLGKANSDIEKRGGKLSSGEATKITFVFVTPRRWSRSNPTLSEWEEQKRSQGLWRDVRAIDAVTLEEWLELCPAVASWAARHLLNKMPVIGARSTDEFWEEYAANFVPRLAERVLLCDRSKEIETLLGQLRKGPVAIRLKADSPDEVVAFCVAAIRTADTEVREFLEARALVLDAEEAARQLASLSNMVFLPRSKAATLGGFLSTKNPTVVCLGRDARDGLATELPRASRHSFAHSLRDMGFDEQRSEQLATECARSVSILAWRIPSATAQRPVWAESTELIPALLAGAWDASREDDRRALTELSAAIDYETFEKSLARFLSMQDVVIEREGEVWKLAAPVQAFVLLGRLIGRSDLTRFEQLVRSTFSKLDPSLDLPPEERRYASLRGDTLEYSPWLRDGLATTLLLFSVLHAEAAVHTPDTTPELFVNKLIRELPGRAEDWRVIASLRQQLPLLMEAAPDPLLSALGQMLESDGDPILPIFDNSDPFFSTSPHTYVLWALEAIAWDPQYFWTATTILAKLAGVDPGGRTTNRPINSLREIFLPWHPQTNATLVERLSALDHIIAAEPRIGWELVIESFPKAFDSGSPTNKTRYREAGASERHVVTRQSLAETYEGMLERAITLANSSERWVKIIAGMQPFSLERMELTCDALERFADRADNDEKRNLWTRLQEEIRRQRAFRKAEWNLPDPIVSRLEQIASKVEPPDLLTNIKWLFDKHLPLMPGSDATSNIDEVDRARVEAIRKLIAQSGDGAVLQLARTADAPETIARAVAMTAHDAQQIQSLIAKALQMGDVPDAFTSPLSAQAHARFGQEWAELITDAWQNGALTSRVVAMLLVFWPDQRPTWDFVGQFDDEVKIEYWKRKAPWPLRGDVNDLEYAAEQYLGVGRPDAAVYAVYAATDQIRSSLVLRILDALLPWLADAQNRRRILSSEVEEIFDKLERRSDLSTLDLATREYAYFPLLEHRERDLTIHRLMLESPEFYASLLGDAFKPASADVSAQLDERTQARARLAYQLLSSLGAVPGAKGGEINEAELRSWVTQVRRLAAESDRARIGDEYVGQTIAQAPEDPQDSAWPHRTIRDLLEELQSEEVEFGVSVARFNMVGGHFIDPKNPAASERGHAAQCREWARASVGWPRTRAMLVRMAQSWDHAAEQMELHARQRELRVE